MSEEKKEAKYILKLQPVFVQTKLLCNAVLVYCTQQSLPFFSPEDPVLAARIDKINQSGKNAFIEYQLPNVVAAMTKKGIYQVKVIPTDETWIGITYQEDKEIETCFCQGRNTWLR